MTAKRGRPKAAAGAAKPALTQARSLRGSRWFRIAIALLSLGLGIYAAIGSLANAIASIDPARAYALAPGNGAITARYAESEFTRRPSPDPDSSAARLARRALQHDASAVDAINVLAFQAQLRGDTRMSDRLFAHANALSRREIQSQIWAIEQAVSRGNFENALRRYDIALRTSSEAPGLLYPNLAAALAEPKIRSVLLKILATKPVWGPSFINYAANSNLAPRGTAAFFEEGRRQRLPVEEEHKALVVDQLLAAGDVDGAWRFYSTFRPGIQKTRSRDPNFSLSTKGRTKFDWSLGSAPELSVSILDDGEGGVVDFAFAPGAGGTVLQQAQLLPPGKYVLSAKIAGVGASAGIAPYWQVACGDGREIGRVELRSAGEEGGYAGTIIVPQGCPVQNVTLVAKPTDDVGGVAGQVLRAEIAPVAAGRKGR